MNALWEQQLHQFYVEFQGKQAVIVDLAEEVVNGPYEVAVLLNYKCIVSVFGFHHHERLLHVLQSLVLTKNHY